MRKPFIAGNWKMNTTLAEATALATDMRKDLDAINGVDKAVCPPFVSLASVKGVLSGSSVALGAQNMYFEDKGAFTGEVSPPMLKGLCKYVILGHSERRGYFGEGDDLINKKVKAALGAGLVPILCVGERLEENERGQTQQVVARQVKGGLGGVGSGEIVVAYEPVWAIGTGKAATSDQAQTTIAFIRGQIAEVLGATVTGGVRILYGGSVTQANIAELMSKPDIDGALVGGASLKAAEFASIVRQSAAARKG